MNRDEIDALYTASWYADHAPAKPEYFAMADWLREYFSPRSVLDVGCGCAYILERFAQRGLFAMGIEPAKGAQTCIASSVEPYVLTMTFDEIPHDALRVELVVCTEMAEHIPTAKSAALVERLCAWSTKYIFFTAAPPGQGGHGHINEQPYSFWLELFKAQGVSLSAELTRATVEAMAKAAPTMPWMHRNAMVFVK